MNMVSDSQLKQNYPGKPLWVFGHESIYALVLPVIF